MIFFIQEPKELEYFSFSFLFCAVFRFHFNFLVITYIQSFLILFMKVFGVILKLSMQMAYFN